MAVLTNNEVAVTLSGSDMKEIKKMVVGFKKSVIPVLMNMKFTASRDNLTVKLLTMDHELEKTFDTSINGEGSFLVPIEFIQKTKGIKNDDTFTFKLLDNKMIEVVSNGSKRVFVVGDVDEYPQDRNESLEHVGSVGYEDILKLNKAVTSVTSMETRPILQGVLIRGGKVYSTDSHRLFGSDFNLNYDNDIVMYYAGIRYLKSLFNKKDMIDISINDRVVKFVQGETSVLIRLLDGNYPDLERLIPDKYSVTTSFNIDDKKEFMKVIQDASVVTKDSRHNVIKFTITDNELKVYAVAENVGEYEASVNIDNNGEDLKISMSSKYLLDGLKQLDSNSIEFNFIGSMRPFTITPSSSNEEMALILPVRTY